MALPQYAQSVRYPDFIRTQIRSPAGRGTVLSPPFLREDLGGFVYVIVYCAIFSIYSRLVERKRNISVLVKYQLLCDSSHSLRMTELTSSPYERKQLSLRAKAKQSSKLNTIFIVPHLTPPPSGRKYLVITQN